MNKLTHEEKKKFIQNVTLEYLKQGVQDTRFHTEILLEIVEELYEYCKNFNTYNLTLDGIDSFRYICNVMNAIIEDGVNGNCKFWSLNKKNAILTLNMNLLNITNYVHSKKDYCRPSKDIKENNIKFKEINCKLGQIEVIIDGYRKEIFQE